MNDAARMRRRISAIGFALWELHLYLDSHPNCVDATSKMTEYRAQYKKLRGEYEEKYGPLNETSRETSRWAWISDPWPWEVEANE